MLVPEACVRRTTPADRLTCSVLVLSHRDLSLQRNSFLIICVDSHGAAGVFGSFASIATFQENSADENMRINQFRIPKDCGFERSNGRLLIAATLVDAATQEICLGICRLNHYHAVQLRQCLVISALL